MPAKSQIKLPDWLLEGLEGDPTDSLLNKRSDERHFYASPVDIRVETKAGLAGGPSARVFNVSVNGVGLISREPIEAGLTVILVPRDATPEVIAQDGVRAKVVYCRQTIQGYKVGCELVGPP